MIPISKFLPGAGLFLMTSMLVSAVDTQPQPQAQEPYVVGANSDWAAHEHKVHIEPGSVFDFSFLNDAPAGKYGPVVATPEGHFEFKNRPGKRINFYGVNVCYDVNLMPNEMADQLADQFVRSGYNTVRLHHIDLDLIVPESFSYDIDPQKLDRLEYFFAALKKRGLYVNIDLFTRRPFKKGEIPDVDYDLIGKNKFDFKFLVPISEAAFNSWKLYATKLLTHKNPYTGMTWAEDPALIGICPVNEDTFFYKSLDKKNPAIVNLYEQAFEKWMNDKDTSKVGRTPEARFNRFLTEIKKQSDERMAAHLRSIRVQAPLTGVNFICTQAQTYLRENYDYVDNHGYWNHPVFIGKGNLPIQCSMTSATASSVGLPRELMPTRVFGKPFVITEFNYVWPNAARSEGGILMPAYASLQDWDALYNFDYAGKPSEAMTPSTVADGGRIFSLVTDPIGILADRASALLFRRGDISPAKKTLCYVVDNNTAFSGEKGVPANFPNDFSWLGLVCQIGSSTFDPVRLDELVKTKKIDAFITEYSAPNISKINVPQIRLTSDLIKNLTSNSLISESSIQQSGKRYISETGQIELSRNDGTLKVITDMSECFVLSPNQSLTGSNISVTNDSTFGSVYVISVDSKPLEQSSRILVLHLTDSLNTGMQFANKEKKKIENFGGLPHLILKGSAHISFKNMTTPSKWKVWVVDASGKRLRTVPIKESGKEFSFEANTITKEGTALAYELARIP